MVDERGSSADVDLRRRRDLEVCGGSIRWIEAVIPVDEDAHGATWRVCSMTWRRCGVAYNVKGEVCRGVPRRRRHGSASWS